IVVEVCPKFQRVRADHLAEVVLELKNVVELERGVGADAEAEFVETDGQHALVLWGNHADAQGVKSLDIALRAERRAEPLPGNRLVLEDRIAHETGAKLVQRGSAEGLRIAQLDQLSPSGVLVRKSGKAGSCVGAHKLVVVQHVIP